MLLLLMKQLSHVSVTKVSVEPSCELTSGQLHANPQTAINFIIYVNWFKNTWIKSVEHFNIIIEFGVTEQRSMKIFLSFNLVCHEWVKLEN